jgi:hypothetical protein
VSEKFCAVTAEQLREVLHYNPDSGVFVWKVRVARPVRIGMIAGSQQSCGYRNIKVGGHMYLAHRLAWLYMTGKWPNALLDHINGIRDDNRFANLREATQTQNQCNSRKRRNNTSGLKGVSFFARRNCWRAQIRVHGRSIGLGYFDTPEQAHAAYIAGSQKYHGEFARTE